MKKKHTILLVLLLLIAAVLIWFFTRPKKSPPIVFTLQGETNIGQGPVLMKIWDRDAEDGDTVQVYVDGKMIVDSLAILNAPTEYKLGKLAIGEHQIGVTAISVGTNEPASAYISLNDGVAENEFSMDAWIDSAAAWKLIVK